jgi:hypothetical protein
MRDSCVQTRRPAVHGKSDLMIERVEEFWTFQLVEERLIEALRLWRRSPGEGRWPFASDAPWHLMTRRTRVAIGIEGGLKGRELQLHMQAEDAEEAKRMEGREHSGPLNRDDIARRDEASEWLGWVGERDRRLVILALAQLAGGQRQVAWTRLKPLLGIQFGADGLRKRYSRAITGIAARLNLGSGAQKGA